MSSELEFIVQVSMNCIFIQNTYSPRLNPSFLFQILPCRFRYETESLRLQNYLLHRVHFRQCMTEKNVQLTCVCVCSYSYIDCIFISELLVRPVCSHVARRIRYVLQHINISLHTLLLIWHSFLSSLPPSLQPLPNSIRPVYSCTMEGTIICFTGFKDKEELVHTSHTRTVYILSLIRLYTIITENIFPTSATCSIFHF